MKIEVVIDNVVDQTDVSALVNLVNAELTFRSSAPGSIDTEAGRDLEKYCQVFAPLELGAALITPAFKLVNSTIIHVRSASYVLNTEPERYLAFALFSVLNAARENQIRSLAMPAIGTGELKFPPMLAACITARALSEFSANSKAIDLVRVCVDTEDMRKVYQTAFDLERESNGHKRVVKVLDQNA